MEFFKLVFVFFLLFLFSCNHEVKDQQEYLRWVNDPQHELVKAKSVGDLLLEVKYLPADLLAWKELKDKSFTEKEKDSLIHFYDQSLTFLLTVKPDSSKGATDDILYRGVTNEKDFKLRVNALNFGIERMIKLIIGKDEYYPALAVMENTYGTSLSKNFYIVFSADDKKKIGDQWKTMDLVFTDELFLTGINHFIFQEKAIEDIPDFNFRNNKTN
ncbi:MAG: hypothetical protein JWO58_449 [Chitinophagaceae bacterium]|nr:hypothetical protein [Chitinophagaceae bacterium]